jgi:hypothetical protein
MIWKRIRKKNPHLLVALADDMMTAAQRKKLGVDGPRYDDHYIEKNERAVLDLNLPDAAFLRLKNVLFDGDKSTYGFIGGFGESGERFATSTLDGIEHLRELREVGFGGMVRGASLKPLAKLPKLASLNFSAADMFRDYEALLEIPSLRELEILNLYPGDRYAKNVGVVVALAKRGVRVIGVEHAAMQLVTKKKFSDALALFDHLIHYEHVETSTLVAATYAVSPSNNGAPIDRKRVARYVKVALAHAEEEPALFYNTACLAFELGDEETALARIRLAIDHGYGKPKQIEKDSVFAPMRKDPRFRAIFARGSKRRKKT